MAIDIRSYNSIAIFIVGRVRDLVNQVRDILVEL
jgi:hypothetical protein